MTATSTTNSYKLKSGNDDTGIGYNLAKTGDNKSTYNVSAKVPTWGFTELKENEDATLTAGIIVEDYSTMCCPLHPLLHLIFFHLHLSYFK